MMQRRHEVRRRRAPAGSMGGGIGRLERTLSLCLCIALGFEAPLAAAQSGMRLQLPPASVVAPAGVLGQGHDDRAGDGAGDRAAGDQVATAGGLCAAGAEVLPAAAQVESVLRASPMVLAAQARRGADQSRADAIRVGPAETSLRSSLQQRSVRSPEERFTEGQLALERPLRLWGKASADAALADATVVGAAIGVADSLHESARQLLTLWFGWARAVVASRMADQDLSLARQLADVVARRVHAGDAAPIDAMAIQAEVLRQQAAAALLRSDESAALAQLQRRFPGIPVDRTAVAAAFEQDMSATVELGTESELRQRYVDGSHELRLAAAEADRLDRLARRQSLDRYPDPTVGLFGISERGGAERIVGLSVSVPLPGAARRSNAAAGAADAVAARERVLDQTRRVEAEFEQLYFDARGRCVSARTLSAALRQQQAFSDKSARAYSLGEAGISETLYAARLVNDARQAASRARLDAAEAYWRLKVDLHEIWDFD